MIEDLSGNIRRVCDGLAREIGARVLASGVGESAAQIAEIEARQVLLDWFLGNYLPGQR